MGYNILQEGGNIQKDIDISHMILYNVAKTTLEGERLWHNTTNTVN